MWRILERNFVIRGLFAENPDQLLQLSRQPDVPSYLSRSIAFYLDLVSTDQDFVLGEFASPKAPPRFSTIEELMMPEPRLEVPIAFSRRAYRKLCQISKFPEVRRLACTHEKLPNAVLQLTSETYAIGAIAYAVGEEPFWNAQRAQPINMRHWMTPADPRELPKWF